MIKKKRIFNQSTIAMVYDFDGTLSPQAMQEYTVLPKIGVEPKAFWAEVTKQAAETGSEGMLVYMRLLLEKANAAGVHFSRQDYARLARKIEYFAGVETWFDRINNFVADNSQSSRPVKVQHYIISAGMLEILEGATIRKHFTSMFASEYHYDHHGVATFPKQLITDTSKTQFLFRINKGREAMTETINQHMPEQERPIPFSNMIYIGDGETDVPSMAVTRQNGGNAIAVYPKGTMKKKNTCTKLLQADRVNFIAPADYSEGSVLEKRTSLLLKSIISKIEYERELFACRRELNLI